MLPLAKKSIFFWVKGWQIIVVSSLGAGLAPSRRVIILILHIVAEGLEKSDCKYLERDSRDKGDRPSQNQVVFDLLRALLLVAERGRLVLPQNAIVQPANMFSHIDSLHGYGRRQQCYNEQNQDKPLLEEGHRSKFPIVWKNWYGCERGEEKEHAEDLDRTSSEHTIQRD